MSSLFTSYEVDGSFTERRGDDIVIDCAITALTTCLQHYEEKASNCERLLQKMGFSVKNLPEDLKSDLKKIFKDDDGVFNFYRASNKSVSINADHVLNSLQEKYELGQLHMLKSQLETLLEEYSCLENNLQQKLSAEKEESEKLENKRYEKEAEIMIFKGKLEEKERELESLKQLSTGNFKPKYSWDELEQMKNDLIKLDTDIVFTKIKLNKYNQLPLSEKDANKQLIKLKEEIKNLDDEIKHKFSC